MKQGNSLRSAGLRWWAVLGLSAAAFTVAGGELDPKTNAVVRPTGPGLLQIGKVMLDKTQRSLRFPGIVNMNSGMIEYLVVTSTGKTHESAVRTDAQPTHIQVAMLLLGARGAPTNGLPWQRKAMPPGEKVSVEIAWTGADGVEQRRSGESLVFNRATKSTATPGPWIYNGSRTVEGVFIAQQDGSIISLITDADALFNNPRPGHENDDIWEVATNAVPPLNWPVEVQVKLTTELEGKRP